MHFRRLVAECVCLGDADINPYVADLFAIRKVYVMQMRRKAKQKDRDRAGQRLRLGIERLASVRGAARR